MSSSEVKFFLKSRVEEVTVFRSIRESKRRYVGPACRICKKMRTLSLVKAEKACVDVLSRDVYYTCSVPSYLQTKLSDAVVSLSKVGHLSKPGMCPEGIEISRWSVAVSSSLDISAAAEFLLLFVLDTCSKQFPSKAQVEMKLALAGC